MFEKLKVSWGLLLLACVKDIDDNKLMVLYYMTPISREIYPFWNFDDAQCLTDFQIKNSDIFRLNKCFQLSENIACSQRSTFVSIKELCIFLNRLSHPCSTGSDPNFLSGSIFYLATSPHTSVMEFKFCAALFLAKIHWCSSSEKYPFEYYF